MSTITLLACRTCGTLCDLADLDAKPEIEDQHNPDVADFTRLECAACYGPGFSSGRTTVQGAE